MAVLENYLLRIQSDLLVSYTNYFVCVIPRRHQFEKSEVGDTLQVALVVEERWHDASTDVDPRYANALVTEIAASGQFVVLRIDLNAVGEKDA